VAHAGGGLNDARALKAAQAELLDGLPDDGD
jgi:hypothetical protein